MINGSILQEDITTLNVYVPKHRKSKYVMHKLKELQGEIHYHSLENSIPFHQKWTDVTDRISVCI